MASPPIPRPAREGVVADNRDSGLRASILESALELGVGSNCTVTKWIFNPVEEGDEDAEAESMVSPSLTYASTATSDEYFLSPRSQPGAGTLVSPSSSSKSPNPAATNGLNSLNSLSSSYSYSQRDGIRSGAVSPDLSQRVIHFDLRKTPEPRSVSPIPPSPRNRLRKLRTNGNESDGGYLTDGGKGRKDKKKSKKKDKSDGAATDYESDGGYFSDAGSKKKERKKSKKDKKDKAKGADSPATDYETDGGGLLRTSSPKNKKGHRNRKGSVLSPVTGDESDGGYLSEASSKTRSFFRLKSRSRKKRDSEESPVQDQVPPIPAMPSVPLPIAERFLRSPTPNVSMDSSRTVTPVPSQVPSAERESISTFTSAERDESAGSIISREGLTRAFHDAESVRHPSVEALSAFRSPGALSTSPMHPKTGSTVSYPYARVYGASVSPPKSPDAPTPALPKAKLRPNISAPNTSMLAAKHVPVPLVLSSHSSVRSEAPQQFPPTPGSDYVLITPGNVDPNAAASLSPSLRSPARLDSEFLVPSPTSGASPAPPSPTGSQLRPHVAAYYAIPPPTPPPRGPLPDVPPSPRSQRASAMHFERSLSADGVQLPSRASSRAQDRPNAPGPAPTRELPSPPTPSSRAPTRSASESDVNPSAVAANLTVPLIAQPVPRIQRGRESPFPVAPVVQRGRESPFPVSPVRSESVGLMRKTSALAVAGAGKVARAFGKPMSADGTGRRGSWKLQQVDRLDVQWQPRSASALDRPRPDAFVEAMNNPHTDDVPQDVDDSDAYGGASILDTEDDQSQYPDEDDRSHYTDEDRVLAMSVYSAGKEHEDDEGDRYSMWSVSEGRRSFFDEEKSASTRERFVKQVEAMYGEYHVPPVPPLNTAANTGVVG
ncbi:hypothetical protein AcV7_004778 [Taiwanofungus camphoratus]|nr:hypothetical protein AcV7_004778 [Antrodia cinnamomea]